MPVENIVYQNATQSVAFPTTPVQTSAEVIGKETIYIVVINIFFHIHENADDQICYLTTFLVV